MTDDELAKACEEATRLRSVAQALSDYGHPLSGVAAMNAAGTIETLAAAVRTLAAENASMRKTLSDIAWNVPHDREADKHGRWCACCAAADLAFPRVPAAATPEVQP